MSETLRSPDMKVSIPESGREENLISRQRDLNCEHHPDIYDRVTIEANSIERFEALNRAELAYGEFSRPLAETGISGLYEAVRILRKSEEFIRTYGAPRN